MKIANNIVWAIVYFLLIYRFIIDKYGIYINKHVFFIALSFELISIYLHDPLFCIVFDLLLFNTITDIINNDVYTLFNVLIAISGLAIRNQIGIGILVPLAIFLINRIMHGIGTGDIELIIALSFVFDFFDLVLVIFIASTINLIFSFFIKKDIYPFVPFLTIASLIIYLS